MATSSGPDIIENGLIMHLDAGNLLSIRSSQNLLKFSQEFTDNPWFTNSGTRIAYPNTNAPDGTNTASALSYVPVFTSGDAYRLVYQDVVPESSYRNLSTSYTFSIYIKNINSTRNNIAIHISNDNFDGNGYREVVSNYNIRTNTFGGVTQNGGWTSGGTTVTDVGNGWYRISITANTIASTYRYLRCLVWLGGYAGSLGTEDLGSVAIWGAQLEVGPSPRTYVRTTTTTIDTQWQDLSGFNNHAYMSGITTTSGISTYNSGGFFDFSMNNPADNGAQGGGAYVGNGFIMASNNNVVPLTGSFTLSAMIRRNLSVKAAGDRETIFSNAQGADGWRFGIYTGAGNALYYLISGANGVGYQEGSLGTIDAIANNTWHMVTIVYDRAAPV